MQVVACDAPVGPIEPAPLTSLPIGDAQGTAVLSAFWSQDDMYYLRSDERAQAEPAPGLARWFRIEDEGAASIGHDAEARATDALIARQFLDVIPLGGGRVAFPVGSTGRTVYRVWRAKGGSDARDCGTRRTRILGVRAGRSLRRPA